MQLKMALVLMAVLAVAPLVWLFVTVQNTGNEKEHFSTLQSLEFSHRGKLISADLPMIYTPSDGIGEGRVFLVLEDPRSMDSGIWVDLDSLQVNGRLLAVPGNDIEHVDCDDLRHLEIDHFASAQVAELLNSSCIN